MNQDQCTAPSIKARIAGTARNALGGLPVRVLQKLAGHGPCLLLYHAVTDQPPDHLRNLYPCREVATFRRDLDVLLKLFQPVTLTQLTDWAVAGEPLPPNAFHLTCDDGLREAVEVIAPICRERGVPATFFLTTGFLDNRLLGERHLASLLLEEIGRMPDNARCSLRTEIEARQQISIDPKLTWKELLFAKNSRQRSLLDAVASFLGLDQPSYLQTVRPYIGRQEVARLLADGFSIAAHTLDYPFFPAITCAEQVRQTVESVRQIETEFGISCKSFAFPFGADGVAPQYFELVRAQCDVELFFGVGVACPISGCQVLDRIPFDFGSDVPAESVLRRAFATRLEHRFRGIRPRSIQAVAKART
jgi:peptidoglycan/xylan/chitin deacetylase (PgdA/CDA1 family)